MKIVELQIAGFGKWIQERFTIDQDFQLFFGQNESGKTTLYYFIRSILFGFPKKRQRDFAPKQGASYGGKIIVEHPLYGLITIERYKEHNRGKATVYFADGQPGDEETLEELLFPLSATLFDEIFSFQAVQATALEQVPAEKLQQLLLAIGLAGSQRLLQIQTAYQQQQQALYKPAGRLPELNQKLVELKELQQQIQQKEQLEAGYQALVQENQAVQQKQAELQQQLQGLREQAAKLKEQLDKWNAYEEYQSLQSEAAFSAKHQLSEEQLAKLNQAYQTWQFLLKEEERLKGTYQMYSSAASPALKFYLEHEAEIEELLAQQSQLNSAVSEQKLYEAQKQQIEAVIQALSSQYQWPSDATEELDLLPTDQVRRLFLERKQLTEKQKEEQQLLNEVDKKVSTQESVVAKEEQRLTKLRTSNAQKARYISLAVCGGGLLCSICSYFFSWPLLFLILGIVVAGFGGKFFFDNLTKRPISAVKQTEEYQEWQKALVELDELKSEQFSTNSEVEKLTQTLSQNEQVLRQLLQNVPLSFEQIKFDGEQALFDYHRFQEALLKRAELDEQIEERALLGEKFREAASFLQEWVPLANQPLETLFETIQQFVQQMKKQQAQNQLVETDTNHLQLQQLKERKVALKESIRGLLVNAGLEDLAEIPAFLTQQQSLQQHSLRLQTLTTFLNGAFDFNRPYQFEELQAAYQHNQEQQTELQTALEEVQSLNQEHQLKQAHLEQDGTLPLLYQEEQQLKDQIRQAVQQFFAAKLKDQMIEEGLQFLSDQQLPALLATTTAYFRQLTQGHYQKCRLEEQQLQVVDQAGQMYRLEELSSATQQQLYLALRLAFIHLHSQDCPMPVIIDDGWVYYDPERRQALFDLLNQFARNQQLIIFSSDPAILAYVKEKGLVFTQV